MVAPTALNVTCCTSSAHGPRTRDMDVAAGDAQAAAQAAAPEVAPEATPVEVPVDAPATSPEASSKKARRAGERGPTTMLPFREVSSRRAEQNLGTYLPIRGARCRRKVRPIYLSGRRHG